MLASGRAESVGAPDDNECALFPDASSALSPQVSSVIRRRSLFGVVSGDYHVTYRPKFKEDYYVNSHLAGSQQRMLYRGILLSDRVHRDLVSVQGTGSRPRRAFRDFCRPLGTYVLRTFRPAGSIRCPESPDELSV